MSVFCFWILIRIYSDSAAIHGGKKYTFIENEPNEKYKYLHWVKVQK